MELLLFIITSRYIKERIFSTSVSPMFIIDSYLFFFHNASKVFHIYLIHVVKLRYFIVIEKNITFDMDFGVLDPIKSKIAITNVMLGHVNHFYRNYGLITQMDLTNYKLNNSNQLLLNEI